MLTRRHALSVVASTALVVPAAPAATHSDDALLRLGQLFEAEWANERDLWAAAHLHWPGPESDLIAERAEQQSDRTSELAKQIAITPARTLEGMRVKARAFVWTRSDEPNEMDMLGETTDCRLAASILMDMERIIETSA